MLYSTRDLSNPTSKTAHDFHTAFCCLRLGNERIQGIGDPPFPCPFSLACARLSASGVLIPRRVPRISAMPLLAPTSAYWLTRSVFLRCLGGIFSIAFTVALFQNKALIGDKVGILYLLLQGYVRNSQRCLREVWISSGSLPRSEACAVNNGQYPSRYQKCFCRVFVAR